jgi:hypothetical protein
MRKTHSVRFVGMVSLVAVFAMAAFSFAQNQTNTTQTQSQSGTGRASSSASASARSGGGQSANAGQAGGSAAGAQAGSVGAPLKGGTYLVRWVPNVGANGPANVISLHEEYVKKVGAKYGLLTEGVLGGMDGRLALVQGNPQAVNEFANGSPLIQAHLATIEVTPYNIVYSRIGLISDKPAETPMKASDGTNSSGGQSSTQSSGGSSQSSGGGQ